MKSYFMILEYPGAKASETGCKIRSYHLELFIFTQIWNNKWHIKEDNDNT